LRKRLVAIGEGAGAAIAMNSLPSTSGFARRSKGDKTRRATLACRVGPRHDLAGDIGIGVATGERL
jgi:hypothetical protein